MPWQHEMECGPKCHSRQHALELNAAITKTSLEGVQAYSALCHQGALLADTQGRTALHMAASVGKRDMVEWLLSQKGLDIGTRDAESGWTALHRALFYGQLTCARFLMQHNADLQVRDHEGLCPLDLVTMDRPKYVTFSPKEPNEVYSWGDNTNFNLGHGKEHRRPVPEVVDTFSRAKVTIKQVALCKFHSVFLAASGQVYSCGHGQGGRLGHGEELTCLTPRMMESVKTQNCVQIAAARDHTVLLMEGGIVLACGMNDHHQLGPMPRTEKALRPVEISTKTLKNRNIIGICAGRYHTVLFTSEAVYTFGLNAGQLGHSKGAAHQSQVRQVSALNHENVRIAQVTCSTAATAVLTAAGNLYVLHQYSCRKVASKLVDMDKVLVTGGQLDHTGDMDLAREKDGSELTLLLLHKTGHVMVWRESSPGLKGCRWAIRRPLRVLDIALSSCCLAFTTPQGEAFLGYLPSPKKKQLPPSSGQKGGVGWSGGPGGDFTSPRLSDLVLQTDVEDIQVRRLPNVYRATLITTDARGVNFAVVQALPNGCLTDLPNVTAAQIGNHLKTLLEEADENDNIHDVIVQVGNRRWAAHRYILTMRSDYFRKRLLGAGENAEEEGRACILSVSDVHPQIMEQVLMFMYTDTCDLLTRGARWNLEDNHAAHADGISASSVSSGTLETVGMNGERLSAFEAVKQSKKSKGSARKKEKAATRPAGSNPIKLLQDTARQLGVKGLSKRLEAVKYVEGVVESAGKCPTRPKITLDRAKLPEFYDVCIQSSDGQLLQCHKCVLVARLEYFHSMLASGWIETSDSTALSLPIPSDILTVLLDFLYTDEANELRDCEDSELLCNVLVVADQLLVTRLKDICEAALANLLTLRNAADLLEFASMYNACQLRSTCQEFICLNLAAVLEARYLDVLSDETLEELTAYYKNKIPSMSCRMITPSSEGPSSDYLEQLAQDFASHEGLVLTPMQQPRKNKARRKRSQNKTEDNFYRPSASSPRTAESSRQRQTSVCSELSIASEEDAGESQELGLEEEWAKVTETETPSPGPASHAIPIPPRPWGARELSLRVGLPSPPFQREGVWGVRTQSPPTPSSLGTPPPTPPPTPTSAESSLREMLRQDDAEKARNKSGKRFSWKGVKKQQQSAREATSATPQTAPPPSKPVCPWAAAGKVVQSFRDLQEEQSRAKPFPTPDTSTEKVVSPITPTSAVPLLSWVRPSKACEAKKESNTSLSGPPHNPWQAGLATSPPFSSTCFSDILQDEIKKTENLDRNSRKPLALIQIEERAIHELLQEYRSEENEAERITVERVPQATAVPVWKRHSQPASRTLKPVSSSHSFHSPG